MTPSLMMLLARLVLGVAVSLTLMSCTSQTDRGDEILAPTPSATAAAEAQPLSIAANHCWIDPVTIDGTKWAVDRRDQFGTGGRVPEDWTGQGVVDPTVVPPLVYVDSGGAEIRLWPLDDPHASDPAKEGQICD